jgi:dUTP pyrophosphatase
MKVRFSKLDERAVTPKSARPGDAGYDLTAISYEYVANADVPYYNYDFGLSIEVPFGYVGLLFPRSSISNKDLMLTNCVGVLDSGYRGPISARFKTTHFKGEIPHLYKAGERVAQLVIVPYLQAEFEEVPYSELSVTERSTGGFGSSGA